MMGARAWGSGRKLRKEHLALLLLASAGLLLRLWGLGDKGLGYDEAATALMARAAAAEILDFHWRAAFEHPPLWQLTMRAWSALFGQSEAALRLLPALAGALAVPLAWYWLRLLWPRAVALRLLAAALVACSPTLVIYSQEARMYTVVVLLALLSLCLFTALVPPQFARGRANWTEDDSPQVARGRANWTEGDSPQVARGRANWAEDDSPQVARGRANWTEDDSPQVARPRANWTEDDSPQVARPRANWAEGDPPIPPSPRHLVTRSPAHPLTLSPSHLALFIVTNWLLLGYHYYSLLLVGCEGLFLLLLLLRTRDWRLAPWWLGAVVASLLPIALWMALSPGFHATVTAITGGIGSGGGPGAAAFFDGLWRDLSFGAVRWPPPQAVWGYLLLPLVLLGAGALLAEARAAGRRGDPPWGFLVVLVALLPLSVSVLLFRTLAARYILFSLPAMYALAAAGVVFLACLPTRTRRAGYAESGALGGLALLLAAVPAVLGLAFYFGPYQKSEYRAMAAFLAAHSAPEDAILLYAPRQHLLAKYYLGEDRPYFTAPQVELPSYWPVNAPPVVPEEMDGQLQELLATHPALWLVMTAQDEVDDGEFVPKYLAAVAYKQECWRWLDVDLCRFTSPHAPALAAADAVELAPNLLYNGELRLVTARAALLDEPPLEQPTFYVELDWLAERKPSIDYRVTLRLLDAAGQVVAQRDEYPIGPLLPPTTWNAGDAKPGYLALPVPPGGWAPGAQLTAAVYDPATGALLAEPVLLIAD